MSIYYHTVILVVLYFKYKVTGTIKKNVIELSDMDKLWHFSYWYI